MDEQKYPTLEYLFSGYFNQDWLYMRLDDLKLPDEQKDFKASFEYNLQLFKSGSKRQVSDAIVELEKLLDLNLEDSKLRKFLVEKLGSNLSASKLGLTHQELLESILSILKNSDSQSESFS